MPRKTWKELSERTKKEKLRKGISPGQYDESVRRAKKGGWNKLSPTTQKRYSSKGVTAAEYNAGTSLKAARGHAIAPESKTWRLRAIALDIKTAAIPGFDSLPPVDQERLGRQWVLGFMSKSKGPLQPVKITDWRYGRRDAPDLVRYQTDEQTNARIEFLAWLAMNPGAEDNANEMDWERYRSDYAQSFTKQ